MMLLMVCLLLILLTLVWGFHLWLQAKKYMAFPGDLGSPVFGNVFQLVRNYWHTWHPDFHNYLEKTLDKYGHVCSFWLCHEPCIAVADPYLVEKIALNPLLGDKSAFVYDGMGVYMRHSFSLPDSDKEWKLRRKELLNTLKKQNLQSYHTTFIEKAKRAVELLSRKCGGEFDCMPEIMLLPIEAICVTHFGLNIDIASNHHLFNDLHFSTTLVAAIMTNPILGAFTSFISEYIYYPKHQKKFEDTVLLEVKKKAKELRITEDQNGNLPVAVTAALRNLLRNNSDKETMQEFRELLYVGAHTIGLASCSAMIYMATHPHIQEKLWQEQYEIFENSDRDPTHDDMKRMEYLDRFYKEVLRFVSPPIVAKKASGEVDLGGKVLPAGSVVVINSRRMRFDPTYWDNPERFDPDRFLDENISRVPKCSYTFFGFGLRTCPGGQYASNSTKVILSAIIRNFKIYTTTKYDDIKYNAFLMMEMKQGYHVTIEKRK